MVSIGIPFRRAILVFGDLLIYQAALALMLLLRYGSIETRMWELHAAPFAIVSLLWVVGSYVAGLYDLHQMKNGIKFFRLYLEGMFANLAIAFTFFYLMPVFGIAPRTNLFLYFVIVLLLGYAWRLLYNRTLAAPIFRNRLLYIGTPASAAKIKNLLERSGLGHELTAVIETSPGDRFDNARINWYQSFNGFEDILRDQKISTVLLGHEPDDIPGLRDLLYRTLFLPVALLDRAALEETTTGRVPLEYVSKSWFIQHLREHEKNWYEGAKRLTDILLSLPIGIILIVLYPFVAAAIALSSRGPVLYSQIRVGKMGMPFKIWKFRTMRQDAEANGKPQWATENDPRITKVGKFLRATRLDELPQIWNVLRGEMSLIGPRPERPEFVDELTRQMPYYALRHLARPGLSGWAQVKFPYAGTVEDNLEKLQYDLYYVKYRSLMLDVAILLKTIGIILRQKGT